MTDTPFTSADSTSGVAAGAAASPVGSIERTVHFADPDSMFRTLGPQDLAVRILQGISPAASIGLRDQLITVAGPEQDVLQIVEILSQLKSLAASGTTVGEELIEQVATMVRANRAGASAKMVTTNILSHRGRTIRPKTANQQTYVDQIDESTVVFGIGPAGTGKTYLAMAKAVQALQAKEVNRIILTRPAVEAGERLGFLPGSLNEKIDPYLRPLYDALHDMIDAESIPRLMESGIIEVAPLAYMRGRTLNDSFIILDEAQNTTAEQMKMFLTRLGFNSKIVVTGDITQVDLPRGTDSGLRTVLEILEGVQDIMISRLGSEDVVRHQLVGRIVDAYESFQQHQEGRRPQGRRRPQGGPGRAADHRQEPRG
ncbi:MULTISPECIES: PhoH family protein [Nesterenkonia]|uniref:PhoH-like protein n=1 Tax=Nesterenkonia xinjiangensis TaxID=225327 RepID=A0A7Z0GNY8_9MICC|nr:MULTISPECIES: PhoH family protein [Nesterenkonia]MDZ5077958.1 PhoH family protein [Nesterenkonia sp. HG001]NYJ79437.1 phosphate starvation-inducible PhoH-like protein [Nesterenkonia xinjiangensis]